MVCRWQVLVFVYCLSVMHAHLRCNQLSSGLHLTNTYFVCGSDLCTDHISTLFVCSGPGFD